MYHIRSQIRLTRVAEERRFINLLSSATLVILLKKDAETMEEMKRVLGNAYVQPHRPLGMGSSLVKLASN